MARSDPVITWLRRLDEPLPDTWRALPAGSDAPGLLAAGGDLRPRRLEEAYSKGVFPWYSEGQPVLWWSPDPRMVLRVADFRLSRSLRKTVQKFARDPSCRIRVDTAFERVVAACAGTPRDGQDGTWIVPEMQRAYADWHALGKVHSFETWIGGELVGGLYGVSLGRMFFGESMFSHRTDASKIALAALICFCTEHGVPMIDCQQNTRHLASFGAEEVGRQRFEAALRACLRETGVVDWTYDSSMWRHLIRSPSQEPGS